jgi:ankyrin repeat protein
MSAAWRGDVEIIKLLLEKGAYVNAKNINGASALMSAAVEGQTNAIKFLLDKDADINAKDTNGATALILAAGFGKTDAVELLLDKGMDINAERNDGTTALMLAAGKGQMNAIKLLLDKGAKVNAKDTNGATALIFATAVAHQMDAVELLLDKGADINAKENDGTTALMLATGTGYTNVIGLLLDKGADINAENNNGITVLMWAAGAGNIEVVKLLLARGADINAVSPLGFTALGMARERGNAAIVQLLKKSGATDLSPLEALSKRQLHSTSQLDVPTQIDPSTGRQRWPADGKITDTNLLVPVSFTNSIGEFITDAIPARLFANKLIYITTNGGGGTIRLENLPPDLRAKFHYNQDAAAEADQIDADKKARMNEYARQQAVVAQSEFERSEAEKRAGQHKAMIIGYVIQKIDAGLLVSWNLGTEENSDRRTILLKDHPNYATLAANDGIYCWAFNDGLYSYTTVNKSENTVHAFTCSTNAAIDYYLTH